MITEVTMKRELFGMTISQKSQSEFFSATDLVKAGNKWRSNNGMDPFNMANWLQNKGTKEFIEELEKEFKMKVKINSKGKNDHTWVHPFLFIDLALAISPKLKIETYKWLHDKLLEYRNNSGDSYKKFCGSVFLRIGRKADFNDKIKSLAYLIKKEIGVYDWNKATEQQLKLRDDIHNAISIYSDVMTNIDECVRLAIKRYIN